MLKKKWITMHYPFLMLNRSYLMARLSSGKRTGIRGNGNTLFKEDLIVGDEVVVVVKISPTNTVVIITVYAL